MGTGNMMNLDGHEAAAPSPEGPRPFLARGHMIVLRVLLVFYVLGFLLQAAINIGPIGGAVFRISSTHFWAAVTVGLLLMTAWLTFFILLALCLYHFTRGHAGPQPPRHWLWVILLLNVVGVVAYYFRILEPEQRARLAAYHA